MSAPAPRTTPPTNARPGKDGRTFDLALNKDLGESWTIRAIGTNITNKRYQIDLSNTFGGSHVGDPRMLSLEARYRFHF